MVYPCIAWGEGGGGTDFCCCLVKFIEILQSLSRGGRLGYPCFGFPNYNLFIGSGRGGVGGAGVVVGGERA